MNKYCPAVKRIHWNVHTRCNLPCGFCYLWRRPEADLISTETAKELLREAVNHTEWFVFGGGDPLMRPDLLELVRYADQLGLKVDLQTNAVLLADMDYSALFSHLDRFGLSLDGEDPTVHDQIRNSPGNFETVLHALALADRAGVPTTIRTMVCKQNLGRISKLGEILTNYSCLRKWSIREFAPLGRGEKTHNVYEVTRDEFLAEFDAIRAWNDPYHRNFAISSVTTDDMENCFCLISEDGHFYGHAPDGRYHSLGRFPEETMDAILRRLTYDHAKREARESMSLSRP